MLDGTEIINSLQLNSLTTPQPWMALVNLTNRLEAERRIILEHRRKKDDMSKKLIITISIGDEPITIEELFQLLYDDPPQMLDGAEFEIVEVEEPERNEE